MRSSRFQVDQNGGLAEIRAEFPCGSSTWNRTTSLPWKRSGSIVRMIFSGDS